MSAMQREISAGGVVLRQTSGIWQVALIEPRKDDVEEFATRVSGAAIEANITPQKRSPARAQLVLPKGLVDPGETSPQAALREVREETGITAEIIGKLADNKYVYVRKWGDRQRVFKIVTFYLMRYVSGEIDDLAPEMRIEVTRALWIPFADASRRLAYGNERKVLRQAENYISQKSLS
jgi:8-oxo-dGTP pyrophosphatase MutT (NUDIX family)